MGIEELKMMKTQLVSCIQSQIGNLQQVDTHQLGEAIDMVKDLSEAIYYCTITESMEKSEKEEGTVNNINYYTSSTSPRMMYPDYRDMERMNGYMYYPSGGSSSSGSSGSSSGSSGGSNSGGGNSGGSSGSGSTSYYTEMPYEMMRDPREGRAALRRRTYMEGKEKHKDKNSQLKELEAYLHELSTDITEMVKDASPEERMTLRQKMSTLAEKIN